MIEPYYIHRKKVLDVFDSLKTLLTRHRLFISYCFWGILASAINYFAYKFFSLILPFNYLIINILVWILTTVFGYWTNQAFVFKHKNASFEVFIKQAGSFISFRAFSGVADSLSMLVTTSLFGWTALPSKIIANIIAGLINYFTSKHVVFKTVPAVADTVDKAKKAFSIQRLYMRFVCLLIWRFLLSNWHQRRYLRKNLKNRI